MKARSLAFLTIPVGLVAVSALIALSGAKPASPAKGNSFKTAALVKGNIEETVSSTGNLKAVGTVDVLAQLTGTLEAVHVDFNDPVRKGQPLASINTDKLRISLNNAKASVDRWKAQNEYDRMEYEKSLKLHAASLISDSDLAAKKLAAVVSAASLSQAESAYEEAKLDIENYAVVLSPIGGIVLDRAVEAGETVVGSGSSNTRLFTLAENLKTMDIEASVDELDISMIALGQKARFTVEAYSEKSFEGSVRQIRVVPKSSGNVVSYTVIVRADNPDGILLPGMTATLEFLVTEKKDVVLVPNAALRFSPSAELQAAARRRQFAERLKDASAEEREAALKQYDERIKAGTAAGQGSALLGGGMGAMGGAAGGPPPGGFPGGGAGGGFPGGATGGAARTAAASSRKTIWLLDESGELSFAMVQVGASDAANTEILNGEDLVGRNAVIKAE